MRKTLNCAEGSSEQEEAPLVGGRSANLWKRRSTAIALALGMIAVTGAPVMAGYSPQSVQTAADRLVHYKIVTGIAEGNLGLNEPITRAQLAALLVKAFGHGNDAALLRGVSTGFTDVASDDWAAGYIAVAKNLVDKNGFRLGFNADGTQFAPNAKVTSAETVAFLMKFLGVQPDNTLPWPDNYLTPAVDKGIITAEDQAQLQTFGNAPANRGLVFYLADQAFYNFKQAGNGKNVYQTFVDRQPPMLTVSAVPATTDQDSVQISGTVSGQTGLTVEYAGQTESITVSADGRWDVTVPLAKGENRFQVVAVDLAGNDSSQPILVTRIAVPVPTRLTAKIKSELAAGEEATVVAQVLDQDGNAMADARVTATVTGDVGQVDLAAGRFVAATKPGAGRITFAYGDLWPVALDVIVKPGAPKAIKVSPESLSVFAGTGPHHFSAEVTDAFGNPVPDSAGVTWSTTGGVFSMGDWEAITPGRYTITAANWELKGTAEVQVNTRPQLAGVSNRSSQAGDTVYLSLSGADADGDKLSYSITGLPAGLSLDSATGVITGRLSTSSQGSYTLTASVTDEDDATAQTFFTWTVVPAPPPARANRAPAIAVATTTISMAQGSVYCFGTSAYCEGAETDNPITVSDPDARANTIQVTIIPGKGAFRLMSSSPPGVTVTPAESNSLILVGTVSAINAALNGGYLTFALDVDPDFSGPTTLQIVVNDLGHTGAGGPKEAAVTINITVEAEY